MASPSPQFGDPFSPESLRNEVTADTIQGYALWNILWHLPTIAIAAQAAAETASAETTNTVLEQTAYLKNLGESIVYHAQGALPPLSDRARRLGICAAAITIESRAAFYGSYGYKALADNIRSRALAIIESAALDYPENSRAEVLLKAQAMSSHELPAVFAAWLIDKMKEDVDNMTIQAEAQEALTFFERRQGEGEFDGEFSPWRAEVIADDEREADLIIYITEISPFARKVLQAFGEEEPFVTHATHEELFAEGIQRTLAFVGRGVILLSAQSHQ